MTFTHFDLCITNVFIETEFLHWFYNKIQHSYI